MPWIAENRYLTTVEMQNNATIVWNSLTTWSDNAKAAVLGNMTFESNINPGRWEIPCTGTPESIEEFYRDRGYYPGAGLIGWTPYTVVKDWIEDRGYDWQSQAGYDQQLARLTWETEQGNAWWLPTAPISFLEFRTSNLPVATLTDYFLYYRENPANPEGSRAQREQWAAYWYEYFTGVTPPTPPPTPSAGPLPLWVLWLKSNRWRLL